MSAHVKIEVRSPLGTVSVIQRAGGSFNAGAEIEHMHVRDALVKAAMQVSGAFDVRATEIADSILAAEGEAR